MGCGDINFLEGGLLKNPNILGGDISNAVIQNSELRNSAITSLADIDADSAEKIANAIADLPPDAIRKLAQAILAMLTVVDSGLRPDTTQRTSLPTLMFGDYRNGMMGAPDMWMELGGMLVPMFSPADGQTQGG